MNFDSDFYEGVKFWLTVAQLIVMIAVVIYSWILNRTKANQAAIDAVSEDVAELSGQLIKLKTEVDHLPGHDEIGDLHEKVNEVGRKVENMGGKVSSIDSTLRLIHQALLEDRKNNK